MTGAACDRKMPEPRVRRHMHVPLIELLRPDGYWPYPLSIEQAFATFQWMVRTGQAYWRHSDTGVPELLAAQPGVFGIGPYAAPIQSLDDLQRRFHFALLSKQSSDLVRSWRRDHAIDVHATVSIDAPHYKPMDSRAHGSEDHIQKTLKRVFHTARGARLAVGFNNIHAQARTAGAFKISVRPDRFDFLLDYAYEDHPFGWTVLLASSARDEPFTDALFRAVEAFDLVANRDDVDEAALCRHLNTMESPPVSADRLRTPKERFGWARSPRGIIDLFHPVTVGARLAILPVSAGLSPSDTALGLPAGVHVVHLPSGELIWHHPGRDWQRVRGAMDVVIADHGQPADTAEDRHRFARLIDDAMQRVPA